MPGSSQASTWKVTLSPPACCDLREVVLGVRRPSGGSRGRRRASWTSGAIDAEHDRPDRDRLDEVAVADVEVEDARAGVEQVPRSARRGARSRRRRATARSRTVRIQSRQATAEAYEARYTRTRATKKPDVPCTCGSVSRNSGRRGCAVLAASRRRGPRPAGPSASTTSSFSAAVDRADGVRDRAAGAHPLRRGPQEPELELGQRLAPASAGPGASRGRRGRSTARRRAPGRSRRGPRGASRRVGVQRPSAIVAPSRCAFASSSRARPGCISTATTSAPAAASCVALPPGAAQRSRTRSPGRAPTARPGELRAAALRPGVAALEPLRTGIASDDPRARSGACARPSRAARSGPASARARRRAELAPPRLRDPVGVGVHERRSGRRFLVQAREQVGQALGEPAHDRVRERRPPARARLRGRARPSRSTAACAGTASMKRELVGARAAGRHAPAGRASAPAAGRALDRVVERPDALHRPVGELLAKARSRSSRGRSAAPRNARSAYASSSKTRWTTWKATRRGLLTCGPTFGPQAVEGVLRSLAQAAEALLRGHAASPLALNLERLDPAGHERRLRPGRARAPDDQRAAPRRDRARRCAARARGSGSGSRPAASTSPARGRRR